MYQNCCKKCGSTSLYTKNNGNNVGLYCSDCGAWIKWYEKVKLRILFKWWRGMLRINPQFNAVTLWESIYKGRF